MSKVIKVVWSPDHIKHSPDGFEEHGGQMYPENPIRIISILEALMKSKLVLITKDSKKKKRHFNLGKQTISVLPSFILT